MDKSALEIFAAFKECSYLIQKKSDFSNLWTLSLKFNPLTFLFEGSKLIAGQYEKLMGYSTNLIESLKTLISKLKESKIMEQGAFSWNTIADNAIKKLSLYSANIQLRGFDPNADTEQKFKNNIGLLFNAQKVLPLIINEINVLISEDTKKIYKSEAETGASRFFNSFTLTDLSIYNEIEKYCSYIINQSSAYKDNLSNLTEQLRQSFFESKNKQTQESNNEVEEFLGEKTDAPKVENLQPKK
jgi:hypothetical protein